MVVVRILIADEHEAVRKELRRVLEDRPGWQVCAEAATGREAVELAVRLSPNVVVLDLALPEMNGLEVTRKIRRALPETEVLIVTMHEAVDLTRDVLGAGARGYLVKADAQRNLVSAVDALSEHKPYLSWKTTEAVLEAYLRLVHGEKGATRPFRILTAREREILQLLAEGRGNVAIAALLAISVKTVETHRAAIMRKLGVGSLAELVRYAIRNHVVDDA